MRDEEYEILLVEDDPADAELTVLSPRKERLGVVLTPSDQERDLVECHKLGVDSYIQKPVELQKFQETIRQFGRYWLMVNQMPPESGGLG
jgi:response regulator of citrate/malate metabolism